MRRRRVRGGYRYQHVGELSPPKGFSALITCSVGPDGRAVALWARAEDQPDLQGRYANAGGATFPVTRTQTRPPVAIATYERHSTAPTVLSVVKGLPVAHPLVQSLPDGRYLVVGSRCAWRPEGADQNALLVGADGSIERAGVIGDGIAHLLVDTDGAIWVGYFDEGVFGNFGWGNPGPEPLGSSGLVKWSTDFSKLWEYTAVDGYSVADCYALNVDHKSAWACSYADFHLIRVSDEAVTVQPTSGVSGPHGLIVTADTVGFIGSYAEKDALRIGPTSNLAQLKKYTLAMPNGAKPPPGTLVCRGSQAHLFVGADWFAFDMHSLHQGHDRD